MSIASKIVPSPRSALETSSSPQPKSPKAASTPQEQGVDSCGFAQSSASPPRNEDEQISIEDPEEDIMDMSQSEADEGEITTYSPKLIDTEKQQDADYEEDDESYEPPGDINIVQQHELDLTVGHAPSHGESSKQLGGTNQEPITDKQDAPLAISTDGLTLDADMQDRKRTSLNSPSLVDASDPDDYEPPEPSTLVAEPISHLQVTKSDPENSPSRSSVGVIDEIEVVHPSSRLAPDYESTSAKLMGPPFEAVGSMISIVVHFVDTSIGADVRTRSEASTLHPLRESLEAIQVVSQPSRVP